MTPNRLFLSLAALCAFSLNALAQTPSIEVSADSFEAQFAIEGPAREVRVEIFSPSGELVFEAAGAGGQSIRWPMVTGAGERVADGVYLATVTVTDPSGRRRKRIEQLTVSGAAQSNTAANAPSPQPEPLTTPSGSGTTGKIAKWTAGSTLGNSVMTENANKIGVNVSPLATLHVSNPTQPPISASAGAAATTLLQTAGGKGGNTSGASGQKAGTGASINLAGGNGGDATVSGGVRGSGGSITLQPGGVGSGLAGTSANGNVLLAPSGVGNVGIGTTTPASRLTVKGTAASVLEVKDTGVVLISPTAAGFVGIGTTSPAVKLHVIGATTAASKNPVIGGDNTSSGIGVIGHSKTGDGVLGESAGAGNGVKGKSLSGPGVYGSSTSGIGVWGQSSGGKAGQFDGPVTISGLLNANGCNGCSPPSDRGLKANFSSINPRSVLDRLARLPIQTWSYKSEPGVRHIGAMAQDFRAAFNFGADDKTLSVVDAHGVTMAAIQGLYEQNLELARRVEAQGRLISQLQARLNRGRRSSGRRRPAAR
jgi:hypothetical protein